MMLICMQTFKFWYFNWHSTLPTPTAPATAASTTTTATTTTTTTTTKRLIVGAEEFRILEKRHSTIYPVHLVLILQTNQGGSYTANAQCIMTL